MSLTEWNQERSVPKPVRLGATRVIQRVSTMELPEQYCKIESPRCIHRYGNLIPFAISTSCVGVLMYVWQWRYLSSSVLHMRAVYANMASPKIPHCGPAMGWAVLCLF